MRPEWAGSNMDRVASIMHPNLEMLGCEKLCDRSREFVIQNALSHDQRLTAPGLNVYYGRRIVRIKNDAIMGESF